MKHMHNAREAYAQWQTYAGQHTSKFASTKTIACPRWLWLTLSQLRDASKMDSVVPQCSPAGHAAGWVTIKGRQEYAATAP